MRAIRLKRTAGRAVLALALAAACLVGAPVKAFAAEDSSSAASSASSESASSAASAESPRAATSVDSDELNRVDPTQRADNSFIYDTTIESLMDEATLYDGRTVQIVGEAIGDLIRANDADDNCWVMLTSTDVDNPSSMSVLISADQASQIDHFGRYGVTGTTLQVRGEYHQACSEHDGQTDIHVTDSAVIARGVETPDPFDADRFIPGILAVLLGAALMGIYYIARERLR